MELTVSFEHSYSHPKQPSTLISPEAVKVSKTDTEETPVRK